MSNLEKSSMYDGIGCFFTVIAIAILVLLIDGTITKIVLKLFNIN